MRSLRPSPIEGGTIWLAPDADPSWSRGLPREGLALAAGRGAVVLVPVAGGRAVVRAYRRGGMLRALLPDAFASAARARAEVAALERLAPLGIAPRPLALEVTGAPLVRLRLATAEVEGGADLLRLEATGGERLAIARAAGRAVRAMHDAGVAHRDLNASNLLVVRGGSPGEVRVVLLDFDGARVRATPVPAARRRAEVARLCRSLDKWLATSSTPAAVRAAFLRAALPLGERRDALRAARRAWRWRAALGRRPRPLPAR